MITKALVEHYLRATNGEQLPSNCILPHESLPFWVYPRIFGGPAYCHDHLYNLGLCAAAESLYASYLEDALRPIDEQRLLIAEYHKSLKRAGIDPEAWERAR